MALVVDVIDRSGLSNKMCSQLQPTKTKVTLYFPFIPAKGVFPLFITNKMECISFKSGCVVVRVVKNLKGDWFVVLR